MKRKHAARTQFHFVLRPFFKAILLILTNLAIIAHAENHFAANPSEISAMKCMSLQSPSRKEMEDFLFSYQANPDDRISEQVGDFHFQNEVPEYIELFKRLHTIKSYQKLNLSFLNKGKKCDQVFCVMSENYGDEAALQMLYILSRFGLSTSPATSALPRQYRKWKATELSEIITALESLPPQFYPLDDRVLLRFLEGYTRAIYGDEGDSVLANARMEFFDAWAKSDASVRFYTILHELGHVLGARAGFDTSPEWLSLWDSNHISGYAKTNPYEAFAETFVAYRIVPEKLKQIDFKKYEFFKNTVYKGLEFGQTSSCVETFKNFKNQVALARHHYNELVNWTLESQKQVQQEVTRLQSAYPFEKRAFQKCTATYLSELIDKNNRENTLECIRKVFVERGLQVEMNEHGKENSYTLTNRITDIQVPRKNLILIRERLRGLVLQEFKTFYNSRRYLWSGTPREIEEGLERIMDQSSTILLRNDMREYLKIVMVQSLNNKTRTASSLFLETAPDFEAILPR